MENVLNDREVRVLGCLIEKELTTPEYYPLSLNALTNACNQKSNRDPVVGYDESDVVRALEGLRFKQLALISAEGGRVQKFRHALVEKMRLDRSELAVLCELLVRGPQTVGELRTRCDRMNPFSDLQAVEEVLAELMERTPPLVTRLPRQAGRKENRYAHLFAGEPPEEDAATPSEGRVRGRGDSEQIAALEAEVATLREEVAELRRQVADFRAQLE